MFVAKIPSLGVALGGILIAVTSHVATAHADDPITEMLDNVHNTITVADNLLVFGTNALFAGDIPAALNDDLAGLDNLLLGPVDNVLVDATEILSNDQVAGQLIIPTVDPIPTDWAEGWAAAQALIESADSQFAIAATDFASGDYAAAVLFDVSASDLMWVEAPNALILGSVDSLFGL